MGASSKFSNYQAQQLQEEHVNVIMQAQCTIIEAQLKGAPDSWTLDSDFVAAVRSMANALGTGNQANVMYQFVGSYGTHVLTNVQYGGVNNVQASTTSSQHHLATQKGMDWSVSAGAVFASVSYGRSTNSSANDLVHEFNYQIQTGLTPANPAIPITDAGRVDTAAWSSSLQAAAATDGPSPIYYSVIEIAGLFSSTYTTMWPADLLDKLDALSAAFTDYVTKCLHDGGSCLSVSSTCVQGSYAMSATNPPNCKPCWTSGPSCNAATTATCSATGCTCINDSWTGARCDETNYGKCSYDYGLFHCHFSWDHCSSEFKEYRENQYVSGKGCQCRCCSKDKGCGCEGTRDRWCR